MLSRSAPSEQFYARLLQTVIVLLIQLSSAEAALFAL